MVEIYKCVNSQESENNTTKSQDNIDRIVNSSVKKVETLTKPHNKITIDEIVKGLGKEKVEKTLPNKKVIQTIDWNPSELGEIYKFVDNYKNKNKLWVNDLVIIDGWVPTWLLPVISHAMHPVSTAVNYPQWNTFVALNWIEISENWEWENLEFNVEDKSEYTLVEFKLSQSSINLEETINTLIAPKVEMWKPVIITGRWPVAIATWLAEAYSHLVPFVANFQPWTGAVVSISHDAKNPIGTIIEM